MTATIHYLHSAPKHRRAVAELIYETFWADQNGYGVDDLDALLQDAQDPNCMPLCLIALEHDRLVGTVNLIHNDDEARPYLHPWLAALVVVPEARGQGIGAQLVRALLSEARRLDLKQLYLGTGLPGFYRRFGAELHEQVREDFVIMRIAL
ncbi:MAG TPA: GNAT family N-acetyltransferase [Trichocoleus sp.]